MTPQAARPDERTQWFASGALAGAGITVGLVLLVLAGAAGPSGESMATSAYYLGIAGFGVMFAAVVLAAVPTGRGPLRDRLVAAAVGVVGIATIAGLLCTAVYVAKNPGLTTYCVRDGVKPHPLVCNHRLRDYATADDRGSILLGVAAVLLPAVGFGYAWFLRRAGERST
jgi:hypothetical protein